MFNLSSIPYWSNTLFVQIMCQLGSEYTMATQAAMEFRGGSQYTNTFSHSMYCDHSWKVKARYYEKNISSEYSEWLF